MQSKPSNAEVMDTSSHRPAACTSIPEDMAIRLWRFDVPILHGNGRRVDKLSAGAHDGHGLWYVRSITVANAGSPAASRVLYSGETRHRGCSNAEAMLLCAKRYSELQPSHVLLRCLRSSNFICMLSSSLPTNLMCPTLGRRCYTDEIFPRLVVGPFYASALVVRSSFVDYSHVRRPWSSIVAVWDVPRHQLKVILPPDRHRSAGHTFLWIYEPMSPKFLTSIICIVFFHKLIYLFIFDLYEIHVQRHSVQKN